MCYTIDKENALDGEMLVSKQRGCTWAGKVI